MVARLDGWNMIGHRFFGGAFFGKRTDLAEPRHPRLGPELDAGWKCGRIVERANGDIEMLACRIIIQKRCSAIGAKAPVDRVRALEQRWRAACPFKCIAGNSDQRGEKIANCLLAHAALADMRAVKDGGGAITHRAALASTGGDDRHSLHALAFAAIGERCNI